MINLPTDPSIRAQIGDIETLADILHPVNRSRILTTQQAQRKVAGMFRREKATESVTMVCRDIDGTIGLREFRRGRTQESNLGIHLPGLVGILPSPIQ